jgi:hypothetical protein
MIEAFNIQVVGNIGNELARANCGQVWQPVTGAYPKFQTPIVPSLKKKDGVVLIAVGAEFVWHLSACKFRDFSHYPAVEAVLWCPPGYITEHRNLSSEPRVTPTLNVVRYEAMKHHKNHHDSNGECKRCPKRNTPCCAMQEGISGL